MIESVHQSITSGSDQSIKNQPITYNKAISQLYFQGYDEKSQLSRCDSIGRLVDNGCGNDGDFVNPKTKSKIKGVGLYSIDLLVFCTF